jgi:hypothetical protein
MKYDKWQQSVLDQKGDICVNTGRQVGKTMTFSHKIAKYILDHPKSRIIVVSLTEDQAQLIIIMVLDYLQKNHKQLVQKGKNKPTKSRVYLKNGASVISRPVGNTGDAVRGFTGDVLYIDEASGMPEMMWKAAMPTLATTGGQIWMSSTPRGKFIGNSSEKNFFFKCWENLEERWKVFDIDTEQVYKEREITDNWTKEKKEKAIAFLENQKSILSEMEYNQEYLGQFLDDMRQWFEDDLVTRQMTEKRPNTITKDGIYYLGVDIARMGEDESTFEIFQLRNNHLYQVENQITKKTLLSQTTQHIKGLHSLYQFEKIFVDSGGIGAGVFDYLITDDDTRSVTVAIDNSKQILDKDGKGRKLQKTVKYSHLKMMMEKRRIHLLDEPNIFQSFKSVQFAYTNDNLGTRHLKIFGNYTHIVEGIANAANAYTWKDLNLVIYSIKV